MSKLPQLLERNVLTSTYLFLVVNPLSGGNAAVIFLSGQCDYLKYALDNEDKNDHTTTQKKGPPRQVKTIIRDIREGPSGNKPIFNFIKTVAHRKHAHDAASCDVRVMVVGGDGTLMWTLQELNQHQVNLNSVLVGIVPFGTGNDFGNAAGSEGQVKKLPCETFFDMIKRLSRLWLTYVPTKLDLWKVTVECAEGGHIKKVDSESRQKRIYFDATTNPDGPTVLTLSMANYFSIGVESRIGVGFDRNRSTSPMKNRAIYAFEGFKKMMFHRSRYLNNLLSHCTVQIAPHHPAETIFYCDKVDSLATQISSQIATRKKPLQTAKSAEISHNTDFVRAPKRADTDFGHSDEWDRLQFLTGGNQVHSDSLTEPGEKCSSEACELFDCTDDVPKLKPCVSLFMLNIPSFAGGLDLWHSASNKLGLELPRRRSSFNQPTSNKFLYLTNPEAPPLEPLRDRLARTQRSDSSQSIGDGKLEMMTFKSLLELSLSNLQRFVPPNLSPSGWRIYQGEGKYELVFRESLPEDTRVYFQVDGEFFLGTNLHKVSVKADFSARVLINPTTAKVSADDQQ